MSRELDMAVRTAKAAIDNLIQICREEGETVDIFTEYAYDYHGNTHIDISPQPCSKWQSSSYDC